MHPAMPRPIHAVTAAPTAAITAVTTAATTTATTAASTVLNAVAGTSFFTAAQPAAPAAAAAPDLPRSATPAGLVVAGLLSLLAACWLVFAWRAFGSLPRGPAGLQASAWATLGLILITGLGMTAYDLLWLRSHRHNLIATPRRGDAAGLAGRVLRKWLGLHAMLAAIAAVYWVLQEYHADLYRPFFQLVPRVLPVFSVLALPYIAWVDRRMAAPRDAYWHLGDALLAGRWPGPLVTSAPTAPTASAAPNAPTAPTASAAPNAATATNAATAAPPPGAGWAAFAQGWAVKAFFLPLMFGYAVRNVQALANLHLLDSPAPLRLWFEAAITTLYFIDVVWGAVGYLWSLRLTDSHLRSAEPSALGWGVALVCYEPFSRSVFPAYFGYGSGPAWGHWFADQPVAYALWGSLILALTAVYTWATVSFGLRFSNLTHRGIITSGPYRWLRHPAYVSKNLSWWLIAMPFMAGTHWADSLRLCLMLAALNGVYWLRARTEERHLRHDPVYQAYAHAITARRQALWHRLAQGFCGRLRQPLWAAHLDRPPTRHDLRNPAH